MDSKLQSMDAAFKEEKSILSQIEKQLIRPIN